MCNGHRTIKIGFQKMRKELTKTFMMTSNLKNVCFILKIISVFKGLTNNSNFT